MSASVRDMTVGEEERIALREKYGLPTDKKIFVYGGNLGKPQGIPFIIECLKAVKNDDTFFFIVGDGTEFTKLESFVNVENPKNVLLKSRIPREDYNRLVAACDVGMIFLDHRFTIPNFPSRLLSYMQAGLPVLACTDPNTDVGQVIEQGGFGKWCESNDTAAFSAAVDALINADFDKMEENALEYLKENYSADCAYEKIINSIK